MKADSRVAGRQSNMELLRIVSMMMIILHHYADHGGFVFENGEITFNRIFLQFVHLFGKIGICLFVLISGYFLVESAFTWKKVVKLILEVQFYCLLSFGFTVAIGTTEFTVRRAFMSLFPVSTSLYWFVTTYMVLYILSPYLNIMIRHLTKGQHLRLIGFLVLIWSLIPTFLQLDICYSQLGWFVLLYLSAAYVRLHAQEWWIVKFGKLRWFLLAFGLIFLTVLVLDYFEYAIPEFAVDMEYFGGQNKITTYLCALLGFMSFVNMQVKPSRLINTVAASTFGIYLIHDNPFISRELWTEWINTDALIDSRRLMPHVVLTAAVIFCACSLFDLLRRRFLEKPAMEIVDKVFLLAEKKLGRHGNPG